MGFQNWARPIVGANKEKDLARFGGGVMRGETNILVFPKYPQTKSDVVSQVGLHVSSFTVTLQLFISWLARDNVQIAMRLSFSSWQVTVGCGDTVIKRE